MRPVLRVGWFLLFGWWLAPLWLLLSIVLATRVMNARTGLYMIKKTWAVATLRQSPPEILADVQEYKTERRSDR